MTDRSIPAGVLSGGPGSGARAPQPAIIRGWRPDPATRLLHDAWGNAPALLAEADRTRLEAGGWSRASGEAPRPGCGAALWRHDRVMCALWLVRDCEDGLRKL